MNYKDTIIAQATPSGKSGISIIRTSGSKSLLISKLILKKILKPRYAEYLFFYDLNNNIIDKGIALWFPNPNSFTGEDILELHCHGSPILVDLIIKNILSLNNIRLSTAGEFSKRAFMNNKLDLVQAESICDLINSNSISATKFSIKSLKGEFSKYINNISKKLFKLIINIEALIDFSEHDVKKISNNEISNKIICILKEIRNTIKYSNCNKILSDNINIVIAGKPNSGKSSLFNKIIKKNRSIITNIPGTTRDILYENISINGISINIIDTAGMHKTNDMIENIGIKKTLKEINNADYILLVIDSSITKNEELKDILFKFKNKLSKKIPISILWNKIDINNNLLKLNKIDGCNIINISIHKNYGIEILFNNIKDNIKNYNDTDNIFLARIRHIELLKKSKKHLEKSLDMLFNEYKLDIISNELRLSQDFINEITGKNISNKIIEKIFSDFCIGK